MIDNKIESPLSVDQATSSRKWRGLNCGLACALTLFAVVQGAIFVHYFHKFVQPYYPVNSDQLATYYEVYQRHFYATGELQKPKYDAPMLAKDEPTPDSDMRGCIVPYLSIASTFVFGVQRFSVAIVNLIFLFIAEGCILFGVKAVRGLRCALVALGLFLTAQTHYHYCGGLNDMRYDYAGMVTMGLVYLSAVLHMQKRSRKTMALTIGALFLATYTRSIVLFYWLGALGMASAYFVISSRLPSRVSATRDDAVQALRLFAGAIVSLLCYIGLFWHDFSTYYVRCKVGGEDLMRLRESGVNSLVERLSYYPTSFREHFHLPLQAFMLCLPVGLVFKSRKSQNDKHNATGNLDSSLLTVNVITLALFVSVFACVTYYAPTPVVIGILAIPLTVWCALFLDQQVFSKVKLADKKQFWIANIMVSLVVLIGGFTFVKELTRPTYPPHPNKENSVAAEDILIDLSKELSSSDGSPKTIYWCLVHDGINQLYFEVRQMEALKRPSAARLTHKVLKAFPKSTLQNFEQKINQSDYIVITHLPKPRGFEYDGVTSVRENYPQIMEALNKHFVLVSQHKYQANNSSSAGTVSLYKRTSGPKSGDELK